MKMSIEDEYDFPPIKYARKEDPFFRMLQQRVDAYFQNNNLTKFATPEMKGKTIVQLTLWVSLFGLIMSNNFQGLSLVLLQTAFHFTMFLMSVGIAHDGSHNAYSPETQS